jgi:cell division initiation protein
MSITPLDIQQKRFRTAWKGLDRSEVDHFLNLIASEIETLNRELNELREDTSRQRRLLDEYRAREGAIKETMITAQRVTEEITDNAKKEADIIIGRAELEAEKLVEGAQERLTEILGDIAEAKRQRTVVLSELRGVVDTHTKLINLAEESAERPAMEENLAVMRRPQQVQPVAPLDEASEVDDADVQELPRTAPGSR